MQGYLHMGTYQCTNVSPTSLIIKGDYKKRGNRWARGQPDYSETKACKFNVIELGE